jgi:hypothetical protein
MIHTTAESTDQVSVEYEELEVMHLVLSFQCPFCTGDCRNLNIEEGSGILTILASTEDDPFPNRWRVLRVCRAEEVTTQNWSLAHESGAIYWQMAWVPKPCGVADDVEAMEPLGGRGREVGRTTDIRCTWTQNLEEPVRSRLAGMWSELNAHMVSA